jgi:hypothetical protein
LRTAARETAEEETSPSDSTTMSTTIATRSASSLSDVRSVESFSGSMGKIVAAV